jgi:DNA-binding SARP family transcriptional activator
MRYLSTGGQIQAAIQEYRDYRTLLREELATEPSAELRRFVSVLGR